MKKRSNMKIHICVLVASLLCVFLSQPAFAAQESEATGNADETSVESSVGITAPSELSAAVTESGTISLKWNKSDNAESYSIYYATKADGEFVHLDDTTQTTFSLSVPPVHHTDKSVFSVFQQAPALRQSQRVYHVFFSGTLYIIPAVMSMIR